MVRNRVLSFMSQFSTGSKTSTPASSPPNESPLSNPKSRRDTFTNHQRVPSRPLTPPSNLDYDSPVNGSPNSTSSTTRTRQRSNSRPLSMVQPFIPPTMDVTEDTIPELQPIFSFLNSHQNKLYHEGYFLKLEDQNTQGQPNADRTWSECFAQLVGTVLSLWDAAELDAAGEEGEVLPKFLNLTDASLKMIESLPTRSANEQPLQNILSISTAGRNRYLLHFNSHHALVQWTAAIRLAIYEQNTLQEAYTGALIAGKGKTLNNINVVMERSRVRVEEWVRVRFGAGMPWRRCWCVITPPDEKEYMRQQKELKKRSPYDRSHIPTLKGDIKFYDTRKDGKKQKKAHPIATITDAFSAYAIYPQAKSLVDASTLLKVEGNVTIHSDPPSSAEGFVFIMPETRPMVSGFEMLLRFLFPTWDTFGLYGRPGKLVASVLDPRSLMFAMPKHKRYGYLELLDVTGLLSESGSAGWSEQEWRKKLKESTGTRMNAIEDGTRSPHSRSNSRSSAKFSNGADMSRPRIGHADEGSSTRSSRSQSLSSPNRSDVMVNTQHPPLPEGGPLSRLRNDSEPPSFSRPGQGPNPYSGSPQRGQTPLGGTPPDGLLVDAFSSDEERGGSPPHIEAMRDMNTPEPVSRPPEFGHAGQQRPTSRPYHSPDMRRANSRLSSTTLAQLAKAGGLEFSANNTAEEPRKGGLEDSAMPGPSVPIHANHPMGSSANDVRSREAVNPPSRNQPPPPGAPLSLSIPNGPPGSRPHGPPSPYSMSSEGSRPQTSEGRRSPYPPNAGPMGPSRSPQPPQHGRGRPPPNGQYPPGPPGNGPPPGDYYGRGRGYPGPGPNPGSRPPPGQRQPMPDYRGMNIDKHGSMTADAIIDHYVTDHGRHDHWRSDAPMGSQPLPDRSERPRVGVLKTVGGEEAAPPSMRSDLDIPEVEFGPTVNYGASSPPRNRGPPALGLGPGPAPQGHRAYSPAGGPRGGQRPHGGPPPPHHGQPPPRRMEEPNRSVAWNPNNASAAPGQLGPAPPPHGMQYGGPGPRGGPSPGPPGNAPRPMQAGGMPPRSDSRFVPPQGQYTPSQGQAPSGQRNVHPQYQGQAF